MSFLFSPRFDENKLRTNLRVAINRFKLLEKKKTEIAIKSRKEVADYITASKEDRARIRVEQIVREDYLVEAMELVEMYCDLLISRFGLIQTQNALDPGLEEAVATLIWAGVRLQADVPEMSVVVKQLELKYSPQFADACRSNQLNNVNEKVMHKLSPQAPPRPLVERYMVEIARSFDVPFEPDSSLLPGPTDVDSILCGDDLGPPPPPGWSTDNAAIQWQNDQPPSYQPGDIPAQGFPCGGFVATTRPWTGGFDAPPYVAGQPPPPSNQMKGSVPTAYLPDASVDNESNESLDFDDLAKRFESLKKKSDGP